MLVANGNETPLRTGMETDPVGVDRLVDLLTSGAMSQAVAVAAELGIADVLGDGDKTVDELALLTQCDAPALLRLMRALIAIELVTESSNDRFSLAPLGKLIRRSAPDGLHGAFLWWGKYRWKAWAHLFHSVKTGESARKLAFGVEGFTHLSRDPEAASVLYEVMAEHVRHIAGRVAEICELASMDTVVDVGGGYGALLASILTAHPEARGILFDLPHVVDGARRHLSSANVLDRCEIMTGDFFEALPPNGNAYLLKAVLHDWDDERSIAILRNCRAAAPRGAKVLVIEQIMPESISPSEYDRRATVRDLNMLVMLEGRERTLREFRQLFDAAGLQLVSATEASLGFSVIQALTA